MKNLRIISNKTITRVAVVAMVLGLLSPLSAQAAQLTSRKVTLGSSAVSASTTYTFNFTFATGTAIKSMKYEFCTTTACTATPTGSSVTSATLGSLAGMGDNTIGNWTKTTATGPPLELRFADSGNSTAPSGSQTVVVNSVTSPSTSNTSFYIRISTYSDATFTTLIDQGTVAASTANQITLTGSMDESLVFCTGGTITGTNCGTATSGNVAFGTGFSSTATSTAISQMVAATNAGGGYVITVAGNTLTCAGCSGSPTIAGLSSSSASTTGTAQFGLNVVANTTPSVGAAITPAANGTNLRGQGATGYGAANNFKFTTGDTVANSGNASLGPTDAQNYTVSYIANVPASQVAGSYSTTLTYICTATY